MNRRIVLLNLALLALAGALVWILRANWLEAQARERAVLLRKVALKTVLAPPTPLAVKPAAPAEYIDVASKMLFSKDRNPLVVVEPPKPPPEPVMPALPDYHGQIAIAGPAVILLSTANGAQRGYEAGEKVGDFVLVSFDQENAVFEWNGKNIERKLEELRPKQTVAQAAPGTVAAPAAPSAPVKPVASLDHPNAAPAVVAPPAATGKAVTSLSGSSTANAGDSNNANDPGDDAFYGPVLSGGVRACVPSDNSPSGTVHSGYRKVQVMSMVGPLCSWEQVK